MANPEHVNAVLNDREKLHSIFRDGIESLDLGGVDWCGVDLSGLPLRGASFVGAKLSRANLRQTNLEHAVFDNADLRGAILSNSNIAGGKFRNADLSMLIVDGELIPTDLSAANLEDCDFGRANLSDAVLSRSTGRGATFHHANLARATFHMALLSECNFHFSILDHAHFQKADLSQAEFRSASARGTDFIEARVTGARFDNTAGLRTARNLNKVAGDPYNFEECVHQWPERNIRWDQIRKFGQMPLFGGSYVALLFIVIYVSALDFYNQNVGIARHWSDAVGRVGARAPDSVGDPIEKLAETVEAKLKPLEPTPQASFVLCSTFFLAVASTLYAIRCPDEVKDFSEPQWCFELDKPLVHYRARAWQDRWVRIGCAVCYLAGGGLAALLILFNIWRVAKFLITH